ncbi:MAG: hypothetical protein ABW278_05655 [Steroidobacteraceae bacterium]
MKRHSFASLCLALCGTLLLPAFASAAEQGSAAAQKPMVSCTRGGLQHAVNLYLAAQAKGDISALPVATGLGYQENMQPGDLKTGFLSKPLHIDKTMSMFDQESCQSFTEIIVTNKAAPYVAGIRMRVNHEKIAEIEVVWTTTGYWLFNADDYLKHASVEDWTALPPEKRSSRGELVAAANAYLDAFLEGKIDLVPWGFPCVRIEGGAYTGRGTPADTCEAGVPSGVNIANRRFVVDEVTNSVVVFCTFGAGGPNGGSGAPDTHLFRIENGKLRYVHTLTHLLQSNFRGNTGGNTGTNSDRRPVSGQPAPATRN